MKNLWKKAEAILPGHLKRNFNEKRLNVRKQWNRYKAEMDGLFSNTPLVVTIVTPILLTSLVAPAAYQPFFYGFAGFIAMGVANAAFNSHGDHRTPSGTNLMGQTFQAREQYKAYLFQKEQTMIDLGEDYATLAAEEQRALKRVKPQEGENEAKIIEEITAKYKNKKQKIINKMGHIQRQIIDLSDGVRILSNPQGDSIPEGLSDEEKERFQQRMIYHVPDIQYAIELGEQRRDERRRTVINQRKEQKAATRAVEQEEQQNTIENGTEVTTPSTSQSKSEPSIPEVSSPGRAYRPPEQNGV